jgi:hypothetical protein
MLGITGCLVHELLGVDALYPTGGLSGAAPPMLVDPETAFSKFPAFTTFVLAAFVLTEQIRSRATGGIPITNTGAGFNGGRAFNGGKSSRAGATKTPVRAAPKKVAPKKAVPKVAPKKAAPKRSVAKKSVPKKK